MGQMCEVIATEDDQGCEGRTKCASCPVCCPHNCSWLPSEVYEGFPESPEKCGLDYDEFETIREAMMNRQGMRRAGSQESCEKTLE